MSKGFTHEAPVKGATNEWHTPPWILEALGPFDDDPARPDKMDGLTKEWDGFVWLNPPYGPECVMWMKRLADYGNGLAITFARTDTVWFHEQVFNRASRILFLRGRVKFLLNGTEEVGSPGAPSCLIAYGVEASERLHRFYLKFGGAQMIHWYPDAQHPAPPSAKE